MVEAAGHGRALSLAVAVRIAHIALVDHSAADAAADAESADAEPAANADADSEANQDLSLSRLRRDVSPPVIETVVFVASRGRSSARSRWLTRPGWSPRKPSRSSGGSA